MSTTAVRARSVEDSEGRTLSRICNASKRTTVVVESVAFVGSQNSDADQRCVAPSSWRRNLHLFGATAMK